MKVRSMNELDYQYPAYPLLYLKSDLIVTGGDGVSTGTPYTIE